MPDTDLKRALALYAVTDCSWLEYSEYTDENGEKIKVKRSDILTLPEACEQAIKGGVTMIQLRNKEFGTGRSNRDRHEALEIRDICKRYSVPFVIDDDVELAYEIGADGVHLGLDDTDLKEARRILGADSIIGATAHNVEEALAAEAAGADYLGCGAVFPTSTKDVKNRLTYEELSRITSSVKIPVVAIAGITADNVAKLQGSGIAGAATVSGIFAAADIEKEAVRFKKIVKEIL